MMTYHHYLTLSMSLPRGRGDAITQNPEPRTAGRAWTTWTNRTSPHSPVRQQIKPHRTSPASSLSPGVDGDGPG